jgi:hypothetical protein
MGLLLFISRSTWVLPSWHILSAQGCMRIPKNPLFLCKWIVMPTSNCPPPTTTISSLLLWLWLF